MNPVHEQRTAEILREMLPGVRSLDLQRDPAHHPGVRTTEHDHRERLRHAHHAVLSATSCATGLRAGGFQKDFYLMQSSGGIMSAEVAAHTARLYHRLRARPAGCPPRRSWGSRWAIRMSSPSTWAAPRPRSAWSGTARRRSRAASGWAAGTSSARRSWTWWRSAPAGAASPLWTPAGAVHVGPRSAGAVPGPACYGREARSRPSPTPTWCWATSTPTTSWAAT